MIQVIVLYSCGNLAAFGHVVVLAAPHVFCGRGACKKGLKWLSSGFAMAAPPPLRFDGGTEVEHAVLWDFYAIWHVLAPFCRVCGPLHEAWRHWLG
jgi:hypothetical protein